MAGWLPSPLRTDERNAVEQVVKLEVDDAVGAQLTITTCVNTQDITTLGLQGNYEDTLTYAQTERGIDFLMEGRRHRRG